MRTTNHGSESGARLSRLEFRSRHGGGGAFELLSPTSKAASKAAATHMSSTFPAPAKLFEITDTPASDRSKPWWMLLLLPLSDV